MFSPSCHNPLDSAIHIKNIHIKKKKKKKNKNLISLKENTGN